MVAFAFLVAIVSFVPNPFAAAIPPGISTCFAQSPHELDSGGEPVRGDKNNNPVTRRLQRFRFSEPHLGTHVNFTVYAPQSGIANRAAEAAFDEVRRLDAVFSSYRSDSELAKLHQTHWTARGAERSYPVSRDFAFVLSRALELSRNSNGKFDVAVGPYARVWKRAIRHNTLPEKSSLEKVADYVGHRLVEVTDAPATVDAPDALLSDKPPSAELPASQVKLLHPKVRLDFSAIAKGYIADRALATFRKHGLRQALVDAGGDLAIGDPPPDKPGWTVSVETGRKQSSADETPANLAVCVRNCGIATSGDAFQRIASNGQRYSHIIDPRTGDSVTHGMSVTVLAADAITADALASACSVAGSEGGASQQILAKYPNSLGLFVSPESGSRQSEVRAFCEGVSRYNRQITDSLRAASGLDDSAEK